jgi:hypothetical protein
VKLRKAKSPGPRIGFDLAVPGLDGLDDPV